VTARTVKASAAGRILPVVSVLVVFATAMFASAASAADNDVQLSEANVLLFDTPHLRGMEQSATLHYRLESSGPEDGEAFTGEVVLHVSPNPGEPSWRVDFDYLPGQRERPVPPVSSATGNPVIKVFLQREVVEMEKRTGGNWRYFQKAIKTALQGDANVESTRLEYRGQSVEGQRIRIDPYREDPRRGRMGAYARMRYAVVLSDAVPGRIYELTATAASEDGTGEPVFAERLRLVRVERGSAD
jgi:hypothetical protein